jgi:hypothetical protein
MARRYTVSDIAHLNRQAGFHFFSPSTMRFWGDSLKSFRVDHMPDGTVEIVRTHPYRGVDGQPYMPSTGARYTVDLETGSVISKGNQT